MAVLILGLIIFLGVHSISIANEAWRDRIVARIGTGPWMGVYSVAALIGLVLIVQGYGAARLDPTILYAPPVWLRHVAALLMIFAFPILLATYLPGRIKTATNHPMLLAVKLWALAHLLANGTLADVLLFGSFLVWAVLNRISMKSREQRPLPGAPPAKMNDVIAVVAGLALYVVFVLGAHQWLFGVSPLG
jgi:uncharacterized membrane protein